MTAPPPPVYSLLDARRGSAPQENLLLLGDQDGEMSVACQAPWASWHDLVRAFPGRVAAAGGYRVRLAVLPERTAYAPKGLWEAPTPPCTPVALDQRTVSLRQAGVRFGDRAYTFCDCAFDPDLGWLVHQGPR